MTGEALLIVLVTAIGLIAFHLDERRRQARIHREMLRAMANASANFRAMKQAARDAALGAYEAAEAMRKFGRAFADALGPWPASRGEPGQ